jgi:cation:H+ antiporter
MFAALLLILGLVAVILGANWLIEGATALAHRFKVSDLAIGLTVVAFGTSLPELVVSAFAAAQNTPAIALGNVTGSNIANILLILGLSALFCPLQVGRGTTWKEIPLAFLAAVLLWIFCSDRVLDGAGPIIISRTESLAFLGFFVIFLYYTFGIARELPVTVDPAAPKAVTGKTMFRWIIGGLSLLIFGGKAVVEGAVRLAVAIGLSESFIAATLVAVGTSLPELATSLVAAWKKKPDIAVGNVVGSNIFNIFFILGISGLIRPLAVPAELFSSLWMGVLAAAILFVCMFTGTRQKIDRWEGAAMLALYILFLITAV